MVMNKRTKMNANVITKDKPKEKHLVKWTWKWMRVHFHYLGYITDENALTDAERVKSNIIAHRIKAFANDREAYHYSTIANNARDLGGYETKDGHMVKPCMLIRSDNLHDLTYQGKRALDDIGVNQIIDLRALRESAIKSDSPILNIPIFRDPVYTRKGVNRSRNLTFRYGVIYRYHTLFLTNPHAIRAYHKAFKAILRNNGATLFHCVEGRDRTGLLAVLLLTALGVKKSTIFKDYLLTDYYEHTKPFYRQKAQLVCFFRSINKYYGGMNNYFKAINISSKDIKKLRNKCLI